MIKILCARQSLIGDCICSEVILNWIKLKYPESYIYWHIAKKISQCSPLFYNHSKINQIIITDCEEGFGPKDIELIKTCNVVFNTMPPHPFGEIWHNYRTIYEETWVQAGLDLQEYHNLPREQQKPKLYKWFKTDKLEKTIIFHAMAGYGRDSMRSFSKEWSESLIYLLINNGYKVIRLGHPSEPIFNMVSCDGQYYDKRNLSFIEQIQLALCGNLYIGTDSGFSLCLGAYNEIPQINVVCLWNRGHTSNPLCLAPNNDKSINLWDKEKCDNVLPDLILDEIKKIGI